MWSKEAEHEWKQMGTSAQVREEFALLEQFAQREQACMSLDDSMKFLTAMSRLFPPTPAHLLPERDIPSDRGFKL